MTPRDSAVPGGYPMKDRFLLPALGAAVALGCGTTHSPPELTGVPTPTYAGADGTLTCGPVTGGVITCTLDFGGVPIDTTVNGTVTIGGEDLPPDDLETQTLPADPQFTVQQLTLPTQISGASVRVSFTPLAVQEVSDSFSFSTNSASVTQIVIDLRGSGNEIGLAVDPAAIDFGTVLDCGSETVPLSIYNLSTEPITLAPIEAQGVAQDLFSITPPPGFSYATPIPPDPTMMHPIVFNVTFAPQQGSYGEETAYLVIGYAPNNLVTIELKGMTDEGGIVVSTRPVSSPPGSPNISFGEVALNATETEYIEVQNQNLCGQVTELFYSYLSDSAGGVFTVGTATDSGSPQILRTSSTPYSLQPGQTLTYPISFTPVAAQGYSGAFSVSADHGENITIPITGTGGGPQISCVTMSATPPPLSLDFENVTVNVGATLSLLCTNTGSDRYLNGKLDTADELVVQQSGLQITQPNAS